MPITDFMQDNNMINKGLNKNVPLFILYFINRHRIFIQICTKCANIYNIHK